MFERRVVTVRTPEGKLRLILLIGREHFVGPGPETDSDFPNLSVEYKLDLYRYETLKRFPEQPALSDYELVFDNGLKGQSFQF